MRTDWAKRWPDDAALANKDAQGVDHYPGWSMPVLKLLYEERHITASGHETTDTDPGSATSKDDYSLESYILGLNHYQIELLANLDQVPEAGAIVMGEFPEARGRLGLPGPRRRDRAMKGAPIEYEDASSEVRAVYDDIMATRRTDWINDFWKVLAHDPPTLRRLWANIREVMGPGALDPLTKELVYVAVSVTNGCRYCIASHGAAARAKGMTEAQYAELLAVIGLANETNRYATALDVPVDERFPMSRPGAASVTHHRWSDLPAEPLKGGITRRLVTGEREIIVRAGEVLVIPSNVPHRALALEDTLDVDVFNPPRQDWLARTDAYLRG